ncbi:MAG: hypothetical protein IPM79_31550 [Polyangiaceae bacterium]|nr:hypothetical protein [Polyangiaceae bacterium]
MRRAAQPTDDTVTLTIPRAALTIVETPVTASQRTCERALGIPSATYLASLRAFVAAGGEVVSMGRLRLVVVADYVSWLRRRDQRPAAPAVERDEVDDLAAELGLQVRAG